MSGQRCAESPTRYNVGNVIRAEIEVQRQIDFEFGAPPVT